MEGKISDFKGWNEKNGGMQIVCGRRVRWIAGARRTSSLVAWTI